MYEALGEQGGKDWGLQDAGMKQLDDNIGLVLKKLEVPPMLLARADESSNGSAICCGAGVGLWPGRDLPATPTDVRSWG